MKLCDLKNGERARIIKIGRIGELKKRLVDMGVTAGEIVKLERNAPLGDPQEYIVKGTGIAIRKEDAKNIEVRNMKRSIQLVALLLTVFMGSCTGGKDKAAAEHVDAKPIVKLADVKARPVDQIQDYTATVEAEVKNNIAPSSPVRIDQIFVEVGDRVSKGQKLVQMDAANLKQTKANPT